MSTQTELKPIPCGLSKNKCYRMYNHLSRETVKTEIHWIQEKFNENPNVSPDEAKRRRFLNKNEVKELFRILGAPEGYQEVSN